VHQQDLALAGVLGTDPPSSRAERVQVHAERDADHVARVDPPELGRGPAGGADDPVMGPGLRRLSQSATPRESPGPSRVSFSSAVTLSCETMTAGTRTTGNG
jgi:hypothetical protein